MTKLSLCGFLGLLAGIRLHWPTLGAELAALAPWWRSRRPLTDEERRVLQPVLARIRAEKLGSCHPDGWSNRA